MTEIERLDKEIHEQREENFGLYSIFQYRLQEEVMQPLIKEWRDGEQSFETTNCKEKYAYTKQGTIFCQ